MPDDIDLRHLGKTGRPFPKEMRVDGFVQIRAAIGELREACGAGARAGPVKNQRLKIGQFHFFPYLSMPISRPMARYERPASALR